MGSQRKFKKLCTSAKWTPLSEFFFSIGLCIVEVIKGPSYAGWWTRFGWLVGQIWPMDCLLRTSVLKIMCQFRANGPCLGQLSIFFCERNWNIIWHGKYRSMLQRILGRSGYLFSLRMRCLDQNQLSARSIFAKYSVK